MFSPLRTLEFPFAALLATSIVTACADDDDDGFVDDGADDAADDDDDAADGADDGDDAADDGATPGEVIYEESFDGQDGADWPEPWEIVGSHILSAEIDDGRAGLSGATNLTARLVLPGHDVVDADVTVIVEYENFAAQGYGFYVRQNGGALQETDPPGQGYGVYAEGGVLRSLGVWKEVGGVETPILEVPEAVEGGVESGVPYAIRFQCLQRDGDTLLRAKMWRDGDDEPGEWMVEAEDATAELQGESGSFANDIYNYSGTGSVWVHEVRIAEM
jgi:hypothetical protein